MVPFYHIYCFCKKSLPFSITFENSTFKVTILVIKCDTFRAWYSTKKQANLNVEILQMLCYDPLNRCFVDLTTYTCLIRFVMYMYAFFLLQIILNKLNIAKKIRFAAATSQVYETNSHCYLTVRLFFLRIVLSFKHDKNKYLLN